MAVVKDHGSDFLKSVGGEAAQAWSKKKDQEVKMDAGGNLPPNIEGGVAKLTVAKIGKYEKGDFAGKFYVRLAGVVLAPQTVEHKGATIRVAGKQTSQMIKMYPETGNKKDGSTFTITMEDRVDVLINELKKLTMDPKDPKKAMVPPSLQELPAFLKSLEKAGPVFGFRTWASEPTKQYPNPRTHEVWQGVVPEGDVPSSDEDPQMDDVPSEQDDTPADDEPTTTDAGDDTPSDVNIDWSATGAHADAGDTDSVKLIQDHALANGWNEEQINGAESWTAIAESFLNPDGGSGDGEVDYDSLGASADAGEEDAITTLTELAEAAGFDVNSVSTWGEVAAALATPADDPQESPYEVGKVVKFKPVDLKTKKTALKAVDCEIVKVNDDYTVVTLKNVATKVQYPNISVGKLLLD